MYVLAIRDLGRFGWDLGYEGWTASHVKKSTFQIYKLHVTSHFDYCDVIYHVPPVDNPYSHENSQNFLMNRLESMQYNAALAITGAWQGTSREKLYQELGWESLSDRRWYRRLVLFFKVINGLAPTYPLLVTSG